MRTRITHEFGRHHSWSSHRSIFSSQAMKGDFCFSTLALQVIPWRWTKMRAKRLSMAAKFMGIGVHLFGSGQSMTLCIPRVTSFSGYLISVCYIIPQQLASAISRQNDEKWASNRIKFLFKLLALKRLNANWHTYGM